MVDGLKKRFDSGEILHPLHGNGNSVELSQALSMLSGVTGFKETPGVSRFLSLIGHHDHYLFVLIDGLGMNLRGAFPPGGFLDSSLVNEIRSTFPSTTAVALTSLATGMWPAEHGLTGWWTHFSERRRVIAPLLFTERETNTGCEKLGLSIRDLIPGDPLVGSFFRSASAYLPRKITGGAYDAWFCSGAREVTYRSFRHARRLILRDNLRPSGPSYRYLYTIDVDHMCHEYGTDSHQVRNEIRRIDVMLSRLRDKLPHSVRMVVTADHGLVNVPADRVFAIRPGDPINQHVFGGQTGEGRAPVFHVLPGHEPAFLETFEASPAAQFFTLYRPEDLADAGLYGPRDLSEAAVAHLGHFVGISSVPARLEYVPGDGSPLSHAASHGGLLPAEMSIPLCLA